MTDSNVQLPGSTAPPLPGANALGPTATADRVEVDVVLRYPEGAPPLPDHVAHAAVPLTERRHPSHAEFAASHGAHPDDVRVVERFAADHGLTVDRVDPVHRTVRLVGPAEAVGRTFGVELMDYDHPLGAHRAHTGPLLVPEEVARITSGVLGLDTRPAVVEPRQQPAMDEHPAGHLPSQIAQAYSFPPDLTGRGASIAIVQLGGGYKEATLSRYFGTVTKTPAPKVESISVSGAENNPADKRSSYEVCLDIEVAGAVAPGAAINVYFAPNCHAGFLAAVKHAVHDAERENSVVSISWCSGEHRPDAPDEAIPTFYRLMNETLQEAAALGIPVCVASGDLGSSAGRTDGFVRPYFPSSSPYALACGGTTLSLTGVAPDGEVVWHSAKGSASGGGVSALFDQPKYQSASNVPPSLNPGGRRGRGVPDVAGHADGETGYLILFNDATHPQRMAGTSAVAPLWAALIAMMTEHLGRRVGFLNPSLYEIGSTKGTLRDITSGDNDTSTLGGYSARPGWDACTGLGSPHGVRLIQALFG